METETKNIYQKLAVIQSEIIGLGKDKKSFGFDYVSGDKVLSMIKPIMIEQGLILKQEIISIDNEIIDYTTKKGNQEQVNLDPEFIVLRKTTKNQTEVLTKVMMKFTWVDIETGEKDENLFGANGQNGFDKGVGSALTYAERYFLLKYFHIATDEDDIDQPAPLPKLTPEAFKKVMLENDDYLNKILKDCDLTTEQTNTIELKLKLK
jgi:hypothetical protein